MNYSLKFTKDADQQILDIYLFGAEQFGVVRAEAYYDGLMEHMYRLCENPFAYVRVPDLKRVHRRSVYKRHTIYYRVEENLVEIIAVIGRQDVRGTL